MSGKMGSWNASTTWEIVSYSYIIRNKILLWQNILAYQDEISWCKNNFIILNIGCYGYCCAPCMICSNASGLEENGGLYCLLACCCPIVGVFLLRQKAREKYGIEVKMAKTCVKDCGISIFFNSKLSLT